MDCVCPTLIPDFIIPGKEKKLGKIWNSFRILGTSQDVHPKCQTNKGKLLLVEVGIRSLSLSFLKQIIKHLASGWLSSLSRLEAEKMAPQTDCLSGGWPMLEDGDCYENGEGRVDWTRVENIMLTGLPFHY